jgi:PEP-CTERM motif
MKKLILLTMVAAAVGANAQVFYDNGGPNQVDGNEMTNWMQTEDFTIAQNTVWHDLHYWAIETPGTFYDGQLYVALYDDAGGQPGNIVAQGTFIDGVNMSKTFLQSGILGVYDEYRYDVDIADYQLIGGVNYHLGLHANPTNNYQTRDNIYWETANPNATQTGLESFGGPNGPWSNNGQQHAFNLTTVPEPASMVALGAGLLALIRRRRSK